MDDTLRNSLQSMRCELSPDKLHDIMQMSQLKDTLERVLTLEKGSDGEFTVTYRKIFLSFYH